MKDRITHTMNEELFHIYTKEEIHTTLRQIHPTKTPSPDGMPQLFFHKYWHLAGNSFTTTMLQVLNTCQVPLGLNHTFIILIPKKNNVVRVTNFMPIISLCNVLYKLISKVIENTLKMILPHIIFDS